MQILDQITDEKIKKKINDLSIFLAFIKRRLLQPVSSRDFNLPSCCETFHIDPKIIKILLNKSLLSNTSKTDDPRYAWGGIEITEQHIVDIIKELSTEKVIKEEIQETPTVPIEDLNLPQDNEEATESYKEAEEEWKEETKHIPYDKGGKEIKLFTRWTDKENQFLFENYYEDLEFLASSLNRTVSSVKNAKHKMMYDEKYKVPTKGEYFAHKKNNKTIIQPVQETIVPSINWKEELYSDIFEISIAGWDLKKINTALEWLSNYKSKNDLLFNDDLKFEIELKIEALEKEREKRKLRITLPEVKEEFVPNQHIRQPIVNIQDDSRNKKWTDDHLDFVVDMYLKNETIEDIAAALGRTKKAVSACLYKIKEGAFGAKLCSKLNAVEEYEEIQQAPTEVSENLDLTMPHDISEDDLLKELSGPPDQDDKQYMPKNTQLQEVSNIIENNIPKKKFSLYERLFNRWTKWKFHKEVKTNLEHSDIFEKENKFTGIKKYKKVVKWRKD